ncbi:hypothetical protein LTR85_005238 [Meristemomyces frigidus]|nr:hypothetical protein LTR85_005238 [Meristemomyces frigidus]
MKLTFTTLLVAALSAASMVSATLASDQKRCNERNTQVPIAIYNFCSGGTAGAHIFVPSTYATNGAHIGTGGPRDTHVRIVGTCSPKQWVPQDICVNQFMNMCANAQRGSKGDSIKDFGRNNCQQFVIKVKGAYS